MFHVKLHVRSVNSLELKLISASDISRVALKVLQGGRSRNGIGAYNALAVAPPQSSSSSVNRLAYSVQPTPAASTAYNPLAVAPTPTKDDMLGPAAAQRAPDRASTSYNALAVAPPPKAGAGLFDFGPSGPEGGSSSPSSPSSPNAPDAQPPIDDRFGGAPPPKGEPYRYDERASSGGGDGETSPMTSKKISRAVGSSIGVHVDAPDYVWYAVGGLLLAGGAWLLYKRQKQRNPRRRRRARARRRR